MRGISLSEFNGNSSRFFYYTLIDLEGPTENFNGEHARRFQIRHGRSNSERDRVEPNGKLSPELFGPQGFRIHVPMHERSNKQAFYER